MFRRRYSTTPRHREACIRVAPAPTGLHRAPSAHLKFEHSVVQHNSVVQRSSVVQRNSYQHSTSALPSREGIT
ncbi:hypothetical protein [Mycobacterium sp.]|uniref:hypothetical protein n=1 Tax=Mycobacterium sp. TaxID=1785 RepID=UPI002CCE028A|nr:hypothetical protein [Mycobacterium sp.]HTQ18872.1 hypothetical protein [Mycobacterium sp.]